MAATTAGHAQNVTDNPVSIGDINDFTYIPSFLSHDGKVHFVTEGLESNSIKVYDDDLKVIKTIRYSGEVKRTDFYDFDNSSGNEDGELNLTLSQTLFNNDTKYEYIQYVTKTFTGISDNGQEYTTVLPIGFKIVDEDGKDLQLILAPFEVTIDKNFYVSGIIKANDKYFIQVYEYSGYDDSYYYLYPVNRNTANGISPIGAPIKVKASPSLARRGQTVTVQLDDDATRERTVTVTNAAGQCVWRGTAKPGQKTVTISTDRLSHGVNIVNVEGESARATCKLIVR